MALTGSTESVWSAALRDPVAIATILLVVVTAGLWIFTGLLWRATVKLAKETRESADTQADKMERSVAEAARASTAMSEANEIARETMKRQLRAYLYVELKEAPKLELGGRPEGVFWLKNGGQTPAHNVRMANGFTIGSYPFEGEPPAIPESAFEGGGHHPQNTPTVIFCREEKGGITQPWIDAINAGTRRIVMYGEIRYDDVFGDTHVTKYRAEFGGPDTASEDRVIWAATGNEAD